MRQAFKFWSDVTNLDFIEMRDSDTRKPDIWVKFVRYSHKDPYPFDGEGGTLAHAFYPHNQRGKFLFYCKSNNVEFGPH